MGVEPFIGEIRMFAGNFAPLGWAFCHGQILPIQQNQALFAILGTTYGGNGTVNFALPDLRGRSPMGSGTGPGLTPRNLGERGGVESVALSTPQLPPHTHTVTTTVTANASAAEGNSATPTDRILAKSGAGDPDYAAPTSANTQMAPGAFSAASNAANTGDGQAHTNMSPYSAVNFIIALQGIFPPRP